MATEYFYGAPSKGSERLSTLPRPKEFRGTPTIGRIARILVGQGHGFIRVQNAREVYFHRTDVQEGARLHDFHIGEAVRFELVEDAISGARALRVARHRRIARSRSRAEHAKVG